MYGNERHISVLKAELDNYIEQEDEDIMKATLMYSKTSNGRAMKDRPHFRPIQDKNKNNDTLKVKPLDANQTKANNTDSHNATEMSNETINDNKGIAYKTKLESIANIEINHLDPEVITLDAVIKQSIETNSIYPKSSDAKLEPKVDSKNNSVAEKNVTATTENVNSTETTTDYPDSTTESGKEAWRIGESSTLPPSLLFSEHEKPNIDRVETAPPKTNEKKEEFYQKPHHQESQRPSVIKLSGA